MDLGIKMEVEEEMEVETRVEMETERLIIRRFVAEDGEAIYQYLSLPEVVAFEPYDILSKETCIKEALLRQEEGEQGPFWAVCLKDSGQVIGQIYFNQDGPEQFRTWEVGYVFNPEFYGQGYATESTRRVIQHGFEEFKAHRITAAANVVNPASWKLLERLGMRREAHMLQNATFKRTKDGEPIWVDSYHYAILASEWA
ncbi:GNAT family N-acetyltransferase [Paenibacillus segetis]|uniref:Ribosomal-protein-serine acetyltransferase n=1 Tax=Paenibacillus segetis TaxID=1325360 RepID=A0ABQ1YJG7_9BACL|nr:GNAT family protein [Paenibacillus segetis]GGH26778.1 ribosomal-protein-serine acetyltransferase [Paenibacillus segetis]